jgi:hypothetical protein
MLWIAPVLGGRGGDMDRILARALVSAVLLLTLIGLVPTSVSAAKWWSSNQLFWTVGPACRDGVVVQGREMFHGLEFGHEFEFPARLYDGEFRSYPVLADEGDGTFYPTIDTAKLGPLIGSVTLVKQALHSTPLLYENEFAGKIETDHTFDYSVNTLLWKRTQSVGAVVAVSWRPTDRYIIVEVEDCYLTPDAERRSAALALQATVSKDSGACATETTLAADPGDEVYMCLVLENIGDTTFMSHSVTAEPYAMDSSPAFILMPGSRISITHALAEEAVLGLNLGPFTDAFDVINEVAWTANGDGGMDADAAQTTVLRNSAKRLFLPAIVNQ